MFKNKNLLIGYIVNVLSLFTVAYLLPGFSFENTPALFITALIIGIVNTLIKPIIHLVTLPITILTFGLFAVILNIALLYLISFFVPGFIIADVLTAVLGSLLLSIVSWAISKLLS